MTRVLGAGELGKRVARQAVTAGVAPDRLRKWIASTALLQLFNASVAEGRVPEYCVKGGFAVELRNPSLARASQDIDVVVTGEMNDRTLLDAVIAGSWTLFSFVIKNEERRDHATRFVLQAIYNQVLWTTIKLDLVHEQVDATEIIEAHDLTIYGLSKAAPIPSLSRSEQMAQYVHAISLPPVDGKRQNRARNIVDVYLFDRYMGCDDSDVVRDTIRLFERRGTHAFPPMIAIPDEWTVELDSLAAELELQLDGRALVSYFTAYVARVFEVSVSPMAAVLEREIPEPSS